MAHLVNPIHRPVDMPIPIMDVLEQVITAHRYLVELGAQALRSAQISGASESWGTQMKRVRILFPAGSRPALISDTHAEHALIEVINQCATLERLIDALQWAQQYLPTYQVVRCHPTTSSQKTTATDIPDHDIVLINREGKLALFEVSDVASTKDGNDKEIKDLASLGVHPGKRIDNLADQNPFTNRLFMVVSVEFGERFRRRMKAYYPESQPHFRYQEHDMPGDTCIFEVLPR
jgi:hypothetical protein